MPYCEDCHHRLDRDGECQNCKAEEEYREFQAEEEWKRFLAYKDDTYITDFWRAEGYTEEAAIKEVQDLDVMSLTLQLAGPAKILKDRWAREALLTALINREPQIMRALYYYFEREKPKKKRGPKPDRAGKYLGDKIAELRKQGKTEGQIAKIIYGDPRMGKRVSALLALARKKGKLD